MTLDDQERSDWMQNSNFRTTYQSPQHTPDSSHDPLIRTFHTVQAQNLRKVRYEPLLPEVPASLGGLGQFAKEMGWCHTGVAPAFVRYGCQVHGWYVTCHGSSTVSLVKGRIVRLTNVSTSTTYSRFRSCPDQPKTWFASMMTDPNHRHPAL